MYCWRLNLEAILDGAGVSSVLDILGSRRLPKIHCEMSRRTEDGKEESMGAESMREILPGERLVSLPPVG